MKRALSRKPQSGAVLNLLAVSCGPTCDSSEFRTQRGQSREEAKAEENLPPMGYEHEHSSKNPSRLRACGA